MIINTKKFQSKLLLLEKINKKNIPFGKCFILEGNNLLYSNGDIFFTSKIDFEVSGRYIIPLDIIESVKSIKSEEVDIDFGDRLSIKTKTTKFYFNFSTLDYPDVPTIEGDKIPITVENIQGVMLPVSKKSYNPIFCGVLFKSDGEYLKMVGTDTFRLSESKSKCQENLCTIIPKEALEILEEINFIQPGQNGVCFGNESETITSSVIHGQFPAYESIIPEKSDTNFSIERKELLEILRQSKNINEDKVEITVEENKLSINSSGQSGVFQSEIHCKNIGTGKISVSIRYLLDILILLKSETVSLEFSIGKPLVVRGDFIHLIMPITK